MPLYEYACSKCSLKFELLRSISQCDEKASCPRCHNSVERVLSAFAVLSRSDSDTATPLGGNPCSSCDITSCDSYNPQLR